MTEVEHKKLSDLKPDQANANRGTERGRAMLESSLRQWGAGRSILLDKEGRIIAGNKTYEEAGQVGLDDVVIVRTNGQQLVAVLREDLDLSDDATGARELAYADNRVGQVSLDWEPGQVLADLDAGLDMGQFWSEGELNAILAGLDTEPKPDPEPQIDKAAQLAEKWGTQTGQVWRLGEHRLVVGDCTDKAVVEAVMRGERARLYSTDPPYNLAKDWGGLQKYRNNRQVDNDNLQADYNNWCIQWLGLHQGFMEQNASFYSWYALRTRLRQIVEDMGFIVHAVLIWVKDHFNVGRADYHSQYEPCLYFSQGNRFWSGRRDLSDIWQADRLEQERLHPTQKPLSLILGIVSNSSKAEDVTLDPFLGSGTTLIACENLERKCRAIEIDPGYSAVALQRWADLTGQEPALLSE